MSHATNAGRSNRAGHVVCAAWCLVGPTVVHLGERTAEGHNLVPYRYRSNVASLGGSDAHLEIQQTTAVRLFKQQPHIAWSPADGPPDDRIKSIALRRVRFGTLRFLRVEIRRQELQVSREELASHADDGLVPPSCEVWADDDPEASALERLATPGALHQLRDDLTAWAAIACDDDLGDQPRVAAHRRQLLRAVARLVASWLAEDPELALMWRIETERMSELGVPTSRGDRRRLLVCDAAEIVDPERFAPLGPGSPKQSLSRAAQADKHDTTAPSRLANVVIHLLSGARAGHPPFPT